MAFSAASQAKINPFLAVGPRRPDGYHGLVTVFHSVALREDVQVAVSADGMDHLVFTGPVDASALDVGADNLVWRAVEAVAASLSAARPALAIEVTKRIPIQGGMAGGSADAAATLVAANHVLGAGLDRADLLTLAAKLGSDVPFALVGGTAVGMGRGEKLEQFAAPALWWTVVADPGGLSTPAVFAKFDELGAEHAISAPSRGEAQGMVDALAAGDPLAVAAHLRNDLQAAALALAPRLSDTMSAGLGAGALGAVISGSGPSVVLLSASEVDAARVAEELRSAGFAAQAVCSAGPSPMFSVPAS